NESYPTPQLHEFRVARRMQWYPEEVEVTLLHATQCPHQGEQGGFPRAAGSSNDHDLARSDEQIIFVENLLSSFSRTVVMGYFGSLDGKILAVAFGVIMGS